MGQLVNRNDIFDVVWEAMTGVDCKLPFNRSGEK